MIVSRRGDMGEGLKLQLCKQPDGDIIVSIMPEKHMVPDFDIEFCNSGGKSPKTLKALHQLFKAMQEEEF